MSATHCKNSCFLFHFHLLWWVFFFFFPQNLQSHLQADTVAKNMVDVIFWKSFQNCQDLSTHYLDNWSQKIPLFFRGSKGQNIQMIFSKIFLVTPKKHSHRKENQTKRQWNEVQANILVTQKIYNMTWGVAFFFFFWFYSRFRISALFLDIGQTELLKTQKFLWCKETISFCSQAWI